MPLCRRTVCSRSGWSATIISISEGVSTWKTNSYPVLISMVPRFVRQIARHTKKHQCVRMRGGHEAAPGQGVVFPIACSFYLQIIRAPAAGARALCKARFSDRFVARASSPWNSTRARGPCHGDARLPKNLAAHKTFYDWPPLCAPRTIDLFPPAARQAFVSRTRMDWRTPPGSISHF